MESGDSNLFSFDMPFGTSKSLYLLIYAHRGFTLAYVGVFTNVYGLLVKTPTRA